MTDNSIPLPDLCRTGLWNDETVRKILKNTRYRGLWRYGVTESVFLPKEDYVRQFPRVEPLKQAQIEELRLVSDEVWFAAAELIAKNGHGHGGRKSKDGDVGSRPRVLNGLCWCKAHERPLVVSGAHGRHMVCPVCQCLPAHKRSLTSWLNRAVALRLFCTKLAGLILVDDDLVEQAIGVCRRAAEEHQRPNPTDGVRLKNSLERIKRAIEYNQRNPGETKEDQADSARVLRELRTEKARHESDLCTLQTAHKQRPKIPTVKEVRKLLNDLAKLLTEAGQSSDPADRAALRCLIEELVDGHISMSQQGERKKQHGWLRGTFRVRLLNTIVNHVSSGLVKSCDDPIEVVIDFKRPLKTDEKADTAWGMHLEKKRNGEIAVELGCSKPYVSKLLKIGAERHGVKWTDGRGNRLNFPPENRQPALFKQIADKVMVMFRNDMLLGKIAKQCEVHVATVRAAIRWWHEQQRLPVPNGRTRAGNLRRKDNRRRNAS